MCEVLLADEESEEVVQRNGVPIGFEMEGADKPSLSGGCHDCCQIPSQLLRSTQAYP